MKKRLLILFAVIAAAIGAQAATVVNNGITYKTIGRASGGIQKVEVVAGSDLYSGDITIPGGFFNDAKTLAYKVVGIAGDAFKSCRGLTSVKMTSTNLTYIGQNAFNGCSALTSVSIPNGVDSIGTNAFKSCSQLETLTLPASVRTIVGNPFSYCTSLKSISVTGEGDARCEDGCLISKNGVLVVASHSQETVVVPEGVTSIADFAFYKCTSLKSVSLPSTLKSVGASGFSGCSSLNEIISLNTTPPSLGSGSLGSIPFATCILRVPEGSKSIYKKSWSSFVNIEEILAPDDEFVFNGIKYKTISHEERTCEMVANTDKYAGDIVIPETVDNKGLAYTVRKIAEKLFRECDGLTSVTMPNTVTEIGGNLFYNCPNLESIVFSDAITTIRSFAIQACHGLTSVKLPKNLTTLWDAAFYGCKSLESIVIPESVTTMMNGNPFVFCPLLDDITIAGGDNFYIKDDCLISKDGMLIKVMNVESAIIPDGVKIMGVYAAYSIDNLRSITMPASVTKVNSAALSNSHLTRIICLNPEPPTAETNAVLDVNKSTCVLRVPIGSKEKYEAANLWKDFQNIEEVFVDFEADGFKFHITSYDDLTCEVMAKEGGYSGNIAIPAAAECEDGNTYTVTAIQANAFALNNVTYVELPQTVTKIGDRAFALCMNMTRIDLPAGLTTIEEGAFGYCTSLTEIVVPDGVTEIPGLAFVGCSGLKDVILGSNVKSIGDNAFGFCSALESLTVGSAVPPTLGTDALKNVPTETCTLIVPNRYLAAYKAADGWKEFANLQGFGPADEFEFDGIKYKVISHDDRTCEIVKNTEKYAGDIIIPETVNNGDVNYTVTGIAFEAFRSCSELTSIELPNTLKAIGGANFVTCDALTSIVIPDSVETIGSTVLYRCKGLKSVTVGASVKSIGSRFICTSPNVEEVISLNPEPPTFSDTDYTSFDGVSKETCVLQVPRGSKAKYAAADKWQDFLRIEEIIDYVPGDANGDGVVDGADVAALVGCIVGECAMDDIDADAADVNGDGVCDVMDVVGMIAIIVGE